MDWTGLIVAVAALAVAAVVGVVHKSRQGKVRNVTVGQPDETVRHLAELDVAGGAVTLLQFSSAFCAPCRATRVVCADVAARTPGVRHREVDAESHLDAVRALNIWRTPTVLIIDDAGRIAGRAQGTPTRAQVLAAITPLLPIEVAQP